MMTSETLWEHVSAAECGGMYRYCQTWRGFVCDKCHTSHPFINDQWEANQGATVEAGSDVE